MIKDFGSGVSREIEAILESHVEELRTLGTFEAANGDTNTPLFACLQRLSQACLCPPDQASDRLVQQVEHDLALFNTFLALANQATDDTFTETELGGVWAEATEWSVSAMRPTERISRDEVWDWIEPSIPDTLAEVGTNTFEAKWAAPIPVMDLEILRRTPGVAFCGTPFEPKGMPDGIGVQFTISKSA